MDHQRNISAKFGFIWWTIFGENWNEMWKNIDDRHKVATITHLDLLAIWAKNRYRFYTNDWIGINLNDQYCNLSVTWIFFLWSHSDIVVINKLTLILKKHDVPDKNNDVSFEDLNIHYHQTRCDTSQIMSVSTFKPLVIIYIITWRKIFVL